ncbi:nitronate monooxygenase [Secundilactobacillus similis]|uniref:nitronate monooxygenase n=1 Tax=Secundilactobacillus similis TaxID=414682 RepID=UPI000A4331DD|nr:nitronate monooxygenase [Secundilactobacillus similis]
MNDLGLGTQYPIIQAPMNWVTDAKLVAAVSNAGGLGVLGTNAGQREVTPNPKQVEARMTAEIQKTKR